MQTSSLESKPYISSLDKMILKEILSSDVNKKLTSEYLSKKLKEPLTTIQRRRKRLEKEFLEKEYNLSLEKFGWRCICWKEYRAAYYRFESRSYS